MSAAALALGTAQLGMEYGVANRHGMPDDVQAERLLHVAVEHGVLLWDTAPAYGLAGARIGSFIRHFGRPDGLRIVTKISRLPGGLASREVAAHVDASVEQSRRDLETPRLFGVLLHHAPDLETHGSALEEALLAVRERGWVERVGLSVYEPDVWPKSVANLGPGLVQYPFSVFCQGRPVALAGWAAMARSALVQGAVVLEPEEAPPALRPWLERFRGLCADAGMEPVDAALGFARARCGAAHVVLGVERADQLEAAARAIPREDAALWDRVERELAGAAGAADPRTWGVV